MPPEPVNSPAEAYQRYGTALLRKAERVLRNQDDAMDVVQTLFVDLISKPPKTLDLAYLYSAVTNRCLNLMRNQTNRTRLLEEREHNGQGLQRTSPGDAYLGLDLLIRIVDELDSRSAEIVVYHFLDDMNQDEVATQMGISRRAVVKRLNKIRVLAHSLARTASEDGAHSARGEGTS